MKRSLSEEDLLELRRLFKTNLYTKTALSKRFSCSVTTVSLWIPISNKDRKEKFKTRERITQCLKCGVEYKDHIRCERCEALLHDICSCHEITRFLMNKS